MTADCCPHGHPFSSFNRCVECATSTPAIPNLPCGCHPRGDGCNECNRASTPASTTPASSTPPAVDAVTVVRAKIAALAHRCSPACPGWAVFNADTDPVVQSCNDCWHGHADPLTDVDLDALPEACKELEVANEILERPWPMRSEYVQPYRSDRPCRCGCSTFRACSMDPCEHCCACDDARPTPIADSPILAAVFAAMDEAEGLHGPEGDDYLALMRAIEGEARRRRYAYDGGAQDKPSPRKVFPIIEK